MKIDRERLAAPVSDAAAADTRPAPPPSARILRKAASAPHDAGSRDELASSVDHAGRFADALNVGIHRQPIPGDAGDAIGKDAGAAVMRAAEGSGHGLPNDLRSRFESSLGADLGSVRVHTDDTAAVAASELGAKAYAVGQDVYMGAGHYAPGTESGDLLLAHEVAHTVQQRTNDGRPHCKLEVSEPTDSIERAADDAAVAMVRGAPAPALTSSSSAAIPRIPENGAAPQPATPSQPTSAHAQGGSSGALAIGEAIDRANEAQATAILGALRRAQGHAPCAPVETPVAVELENRTVMVSGTELPDLVARARARSQALGGSGADPAPDTAAGEGNQPGMCTAVPGDNTPLSPAAAQSREALHTEITQLQTASTALITHTYDYLQRNWTAFIGYTHRASALPWQNGQIAEFLRGKIGSYAGQAGAAGGRALGSRIPIPGAGALLGWLGGQLASRGAQWLVDQSTGRQPNAEEARVRDTQVAQARATNDRNQQLSDGRDQDISSANARITSDYQAPLGQTTSTEDFNSLHFAIQRDHSTIAEHAAHVDPNQRDLCQAMVREWSAGMAVGARDHRHEVDGATFDRARDYGWQQQNFDGTTDLFVYQIQARCQSRHYDASAWVASLRDALRQHPGASAENLRSALAPQLTRTVVSTANEPAVQLTAELAVDHGALTLAALRGPGDSQPLGRQDNRSRRDGVLGPEYADWY